MGALKDLNIIHYIHKYNTKIYFETGLGMCSGIFRSMQPEFGFQHIFSVELDKSLTDHAKKTFRFDNRIHIIEGKSVDGVRQIIPQIPLEVPILFFSDAHFLSSDYNLGDKPLVPHNSESDLDIRLPMWNELKLWKELRADKGARDVIMCDDIFLYSREDIFEDNVKRLGEGAVPDEQRDYLPKFIDLFKDTHNAKIVKEAQGTLILEPK